MSVITVTIADQINEEIRLAEQSWRTAIEHAWNAGRLLNEQRGQFGARSGEWLPWLEANVNLSARRAQEWMDLANSYARVPAHTTIDQALKEARKERAPERHRDPSPAQTVDRLRELGGERSPEIQRRLDAVREQRQADAWSEQQDRKLARAVEIIEGVLVSLENVRRTSSLSAQATCDALDAESVRLRQAAVQIGEVAFSFR